MLANVALPAFLPHGLATLVGILVIAAIEGWFLMRGIKLRYGESYRHSLAANWMSTIAGIPLAWLLWIAGLIPVTIGLSAIGIDPHPAVTADRTSQSSEKVRGKFMRQESERRLGGGA
jgi:hypothetical protein